MLRVYEQTDQWNKTDSPETDSGKYGHLIGERLGMANQQRKMSFLGVGGKPGHLPYPIYKTQFK